MKWICLVLVVVFSPLFAIFENLTPFEYEIHQGAASIEEQLQKLELELGIKRPVPRTSWNLFGDFLYWKASLDGVAYATTAVEVVNADGSLGQDRFKTRTVHFSYDPGFCIGIGVGLPYDNWDIGLRWLRFYTTGHDKAHGAASDAAGGRVILDSVGMLEALVSNPTKATAKCDIHLNVVDLYLGRRFLWSHYFEFRPYAALRGAWIDLDWDIAFRAPITIPSPVNQSYAFLDVDNDFNAIGFIGGFDSKWTFYKGLGLFCYASAGLVYGESSEKTKEKFFLVPASTTTLIEQTLRARNATHAIKSVFDFTLGLKWEILFKGHYQFGIHAGYELLYWPNVTQKTVVQNMRIRDRSDLSFQGLILGAGFDF